jgi:hypothetical protein
MMTPGAQSMTLHIRNCRVYVLCPSTVNEYVTLSSLATTPFTAACFSRFNGLAMTMIFGLHR